MRTRFTLRQLEYFVAVGEAGSIARAAERNNVSSPSMSAAIADLEAEFGIQLFVRQHAQGLSLTAGGRRFFAEVRALLAQAGSLHEVASDISERVRGPIAVGCLVTLAPYVVPELRRRFEDAHPQVRVRHVEADQGTLFDMLHRAQIDVALTYDIDVPRDVAFEPLLTLPPYALLGADHALARRRSVGLERLAALPLVLLDLPLSREYFLGLFAARGLEPEIGERTPSLAMARSLVANGFGYSLLNVRALNASAADGKALAYVPLSGDHRPVVLGLASARAPRKSRVQAAFEEHCRTVIVGGSAPGMQPPRRRRPRTGSRPAGGG